MRDLHMKTNKVLLAFALLSLVVLRASSQTQSQITSAVDVTEADHTSW